MSELKIAKQIDFYINIKYKIIDAVLWIEWIVIVENILSVL